ncbi:hypothetical protein BH09PSE2_BH09PSE2_10660 [soil metagenome]
MSEVEKTESTGEAAPVYPRAKVGQDDTGHTVTTAAGELFSGTVADITDGDTHHPHKHK